MGVEGISRNTPTSGRTASFYQDQDSASSQQAKETSTDKSASSDKKRKPSGQSKDSRKQEILEAIAGSMVGKVPRPGSKVYYQKLYGELTEQETKFAELREKIETLALPRLEELAASMFTKSVRRLVNGQFAEVVAAAKKALENKNVKLEEFKFLNLANSLLPTHEKIVELRAEIETLVEEPTTYINRTITPVITAAVVPPTDIVEPDNRSPTVLPAASNLTSPLPGYDIQTQSQDVQTRLPIQPTSSGVVPPRVASDISPVTTLASAINLIKNLTHMMREDIESILNRPPSVGDLIGERHNDLEGNDRIPEGRPRSSQWPGRGSAVDRLPADDGERREEWSPPYGTYSTAVAMLQTLLRKKQEDGSINDEIGKIATSLAANLGALQNVFNRLKPPIKIEDWGIGSSEIQIDDETAQELQGLIDELGRVVVKAEVALDRSGAVLDRERAARAGQGESGAGTVAARVMQEGQSGAAGVSSTTSATQTSEIHLQEFARRLRVMFDLPTAAGASPVALPAQMTAALTSIQALLNKMSEGNGSNPSNTAADSDWDKAWDEIEKSLKDILGPFKGTGTGKPAHPSGEKLSDEFDRLLGEIRDELDQRAGSNPKPLPPDFAVPNRDRILDMLRNTATSARTVQDIQSSTSPPSPRVDGSGRPESGGGTQPAINSPGEGSAARKIGAEQAATSQIQQSNSEASQVTGEAGTSSGATVIPDRRTTQPGPRWTPAELTRYGGGGVVQDRPTPTVNPDSIAPGTLPQIVEPKETGQAAVQDRPGPIVKPETIPPNMLAQTAQSSSTQVATSQVTQSTASSATQQQSATTDRTIPVNIFNTWNPSYSRRKERVQIGKRIEDLRNWIVGAEAKLKIKADPMLGGKLKKWQEELDELTGKDSSADEFAAQSSTSSSSIQQSVIVNSSTTSATTPSSPSPPSLFSALEEKYGLASLMDAPSSGIKHTFAQAADGSLIVPVGDENFYVKPTNEKVALAAAGSDRAYNYDIYFDETAGKRVVFMNAPLKDGQIVSRDGYTYLIVNPKLKQVATALPLNNALAVAGSVSAGAPQPSFGLMDILRLSLKAQETIGAIQASQQVEALTLGGDIAKSGVNIAWNIHQTRSAFEASERARAITLGGNMAVQGATRAVYGVDHGLNLFTEHVSVPGYYWAKDGIKTGLAGQQQMGINPAGAAGAPMMVPVNTPMGPALIPAPAAP